MNGWGGANGVSAVSWLATLLGMSLAGFSRGLDGWCWLSSDVLGTDGDDDLALYVAMMTTAHV